MEQQAIEPTIKRLKPRALVLMADETDLEKIKDFIETLGEVKTCLWNIRSVKYYSESDKETKRQTPAI